MRALLPPPSETRDRWALVRSTRSRASSLAVPGLAAGGLMSIGLFLAELPLVSLALLAASAVWVALVGAKPRDPHISPDAIVSFDARETYRSILLAQAEIESMVAGSPALASTLEQTIGRCRAMATLCGRMARLGNPIQRYLDCHDPAFLPFELTKLRARSEGTKDAAAIGALGHAAVARTRQMDAHDELLAIRDRIQARLELVRAGLESFATMIVKLQVTNDEQLLLYAESVADQVDGVDDELRVLESALVVDAAA